MPLIMLSWQLTLCTLPPCLLLQANSHQLPHLTHLIMLCCADALQTGQDLAPLNTEAQVAEVKQAMEEEMDADAELLGLKRKKKPATAATDDTAAAGAAGASSSGAAEGAAGDGAAEASTSGAGGDDELVSRGSSSSATKPVHCSSNGTLSAVCVCTWRW